MPKLTGHTFYKGVTHLNHHAIAQLHDRYQPFLDHLATVAETFNEEFEKHDISIRVAAEDVSHRLLRGNDGVNRFLNGESDGVLHIPQVQTFCAILASLLANPARNIAVNGVTQCGKTGTSNATYLLGPIMYLLEGSRYATVMLTINRQSSYDQTNNEFERFLSLYGDFLLFFRTDGAPVDVDGHEFTDLTYNIYWEHVLKGILPRELGLARPTDQIRRRSPGRTHMSDIQKVFDIAMDEKAILALLVDETHFGSEVGGTQDKIFTYILPNLLSAASRNIFIGFSATNWELCNLDNVSQIMHRLGEGYSGFNFFNGQTVDSTLSSNPPVYYGISTFQRRYCFTRLDEIRSNAYADYEAFNQHPRLTRLHRGFWNYQRFVESALVNVIHWALGIDKFLLNHPINLNPQNGKGLALRFCRANDKTREFIENIKMHLDPSIDIIEYFDGGNRVRIKDRINRRSDLSRPYLILLTASGRLADSFPPGCTYYIDMTLQSQNYTALMQGTVGRATGYFKHSLVILSDENAEHLDMFVQNKGGAETGKVGMRVIQTTTKRGRILIYLDRTTITDRFILGKIAALDADLHARGYFKDIDWEFMQRPKSRGPAGGKCAIWDIFDDATLTYIEQHAGDFIPNLSEVSLQLLRPGQPMMGNSYQLRIEHGKSVGVVGLRKGRFKDIGGAKTHSQASPDVGQTKVEDRKGMTLHHPQIHYSTMDGTIVGITLRCQRLYHIWDAADIVDTTLPSQRSHMFEFATEGEREVVKKHEGSK